MTIRTYVAAAALMATVMAGNALAAGAPSTDYAGPSLNYKTTVPGTYTLDKTHASVIFKVDHLGFSNFAGKFDDITGTATVNPVDLSKSGVVITIDADSIDTNVDELDEKLEKADWFDADKFKSITFTSTKIEVTGKANDGKTKGKVHGMLSLKGVTKPVVLDVVFNGHGVGPFGGGERIGFDGTTTIKRSDFGLGNLVPLVGDFVKVQIAVEFTKS